MPLDSDQYSGRSAVPDAPLQRIAVSTVSLEFAQQIIKGCVEAARLADLRQAIAVVDTFGSTVALVRMDGSALGRERIALGKARAAVFYQQSTQDAVAMLENKPLLRDNTLHMFAGELFLWQGGLPIRSDTGLILGGVGVSGAAGDQDEDIARAGLAASARLMNGLEKP